jgi:hypothetical protein
LSEVSFAHLCMGFIRTKIVRTSSAWFQRVYSLWPAVVFLWLFKLT